MPGLHEFCYTRRKIIAGALALNHMEKNPESQWAHKMNALINEYATKSKERELFGLEPLPENEDAGVSNDNPHEENRINTGCLGAHRQQYPQRQPKKLHSLEPCCSTLMVTGPFSPWTDSSSKRSVAGSNPSVNTRTRIKQATGAARSPACRAASHARQASRRTQVTVAPDHGNRPPRVRG
jgi:hypothetical protein